MALLSLTTPLSSSCPKVAGSRNSSRHSSSTSVRKPPAMVAIPSPLRNYGGLFLRQSKRRSLQVVRMAPDEEKMTRRSPLDFPIEWERPKPGRRPDIFPQFSPMKTPIPPPMPCDPPEEDEEDEEEKKEEEEEDPEKEEDPYKPE